MNSRWSPWQMLHFCSSLSPMPSLCSTRVSKMFTADWRARIYWIKDICNENTVKETAKSEHGVPELQTLPSWLIPIAWPQLCYKSEHGEHLSLTRLQAYPLEMTMQCRSHWTGIFRTVSLSNNTINRRDNNSDHFNNISVDRILLVLTYYSTSPFYSHLMWKRNK